MNTPGLWNAPTAFIPLTYQDDSTAVFKAAQGMG